MQLRTAFLTADDSGDGELDLNEFIRAFGKVLGKGLNYKQLNQLFMRIDADSGGSVGKYLSSFTIVALLKNLSFKNELCWYICAFSDIDWNEFMNYMLIENTTLSSMK